MTGRNNHPRNDGPASHPSRLDQFGQHDQQEEKKKSKQKSNDTC